MKINLKQMQSRTDKRKEISEYIFVSKYSRTTNGKKETWDEAVARVMQMHFEMLEPVAKDKKLFNEVFQDAWQGYQKKQILGAQRALQYGGAQLKQHHTRLYNCASSYCNRIDFFKELMYLLLSGCGTGYSVQKIHTSQLPKVKGCDNSRKEVFVVPDSIEGWSFAVDKLIHSYYEGLPCVEFDFSQIRPEGSYISGGFKAPGSAPLEKALNKINKILSKVKDRKLRPFELHRIACIIADSVISGGIRRSAMIALFDADEQEMIECKAEPNWFYEYPELSRANNSVVILPDTPKEVYDGIFENIKKFGEPGFAFLKNPWFLYNPCFEVGMFPQIKVGNAIYYGWSFCNLTEINGALVETSEDFYVACRRAAILGTLQAFYTNFNVLSPASIKIAQRDALIGVGITGMCQNPDILFNPEVQRKGAKIVKEWNKKVADLLGMNPAARTTVVKPAGNSSQLLGTSSGISPFHFRKYIRHIQASHNEQAVNEILKVNPQMITKSPYNPGKEYIVAFPVELDEHSLTRQDLTTNQFLEYIRLTQNNWIEEGTNFEHPSTKENPELRMNVSNTVTVKDGEWDFVRDYLWQYRNEFCGVSLLPESGDLQYPQAPYTSYLDEKELAETYGKGAVLSSGLIVDGLSLFESIWKACDAARGYNMELLKCDKNDVTEFIGSHIVGDRFLVEINGISISDVNAVIDYLNNRKDARLDWVRRFKKFAKNYFNGDEEKCANCLKHVDIFHKWQKICETKTINWGDIEWEEFEREAGEDVAAACHGGACELK